MAHPDKAAPVAGTSTREVTRVVAAGYTLSVTAVCTDDTTCKHSGNNWEASMQELPPPLPRGAEPRPTGHSLRWPHSATREAEESEELPTTTPRNPIGAGEVPRQEDFVAGDGELPMTTPRKPFALKEAARQEDWLQRLHSNGCLPTRSCSVTSATSRCTSSQSCSTDGNHGLVGPPVGPPPLLRRPAPRGGHACSRQPLRATRRGERDHQGLPEVVQRQRLIPQDCRTFLSQCQQGVAIRGCSSDTKRPSSQLPQAGQHRDRSARLQKIRAMIMDQEHTCTTANSLRQCLEHPDGHTDASFVARLRSEVLDHRRVWADVAADKALRVEASLQTACSE